MSTICKQFRIEGRVQGVFYRSTTRREAQALHLTGFARNEQDGTVTVVVCGEEAAVQALQDWLRKGPPASKVSAVIEQACETQIFSDFKTI